MFNHQLISNVFFFLFGFVYSHWDVFYFNVSLNKRVFFSYKISFFLNAFIIILIHFFSRHVCSHSCPINIFVFRSIRCIPTRSSWIRVRDKSVIRRFNYYIYLKWNDNYVKQQQQQQKSIKIIIYHFNIKTIQKQYLTDCVLSIFRSYIFGR